jgi:hypothetical protein
MKKDNELHLTCSCHSHELHFEKDHEDDMWYVSFWQRGYQTDTSWRYRLKCIWYILKHGRPYGDEVVLETADMVELNRYIKHQLDDIKS